MIHYHGGPIFPDSAAIKVWSGRHGLVSFARPSQIGLVAEITQSFVLDNGAFSFWKRGKEIRWSEYYDWCAKWINHPSCDWVVIPDVIEGGAKENDKLLKEWPFDSRGVPVFHLDEDASRLQKLCEEWPRVALGSCSKYDVSIPRACLRRLIEIIPTVCDDFGHPKAKLHGLRMLRPSIFTQIPLASADSSVVARKMGFDVFWKNGVAPFSRQVRGLVMVDRIEHFNSPARITSTKGGFGI